MNTTTTVPGKCASCGASCNYLARLCYGCEIKAERDAAMYWTIARGLVAFAEVAARATASAATGEAA